MCCFIADQNDQSKSSDINYTERQEKGEEKTQNKGSEEFTPISNSPIDDVNSNSNADSTDSVDDDTDNIDDTDVHQPTNIEVAVNHI